MAKKIPPRTEANDESATAEAPPARQERRRRGRRETATADTFATSSDPTAEAPADTSAAESGQVRPTEDDIRMRAYLRYLERGGLHGLEFEDWLEAERELKTQK